MSTSGTTRTTAYQEYVFSNLPERVMEGQGIYNYQELADLVGLKPTHNFRKRVKQLVQLGRLEATASFTERNGIEARFYITEAYLKGAFPF